MPNRVRAIKQNREQSTFDYSLLLITLCLVGFGMLMIYSSSSYTSQVQVGYSTLYLRKQAIGVAVGLVLMFLAIRFPYRNYMSNLPLVRMKVVTGIYWAAVILQLLVLFIGKEINVAKRWLVIGPLSLQPSEITKVAVILLTAYFIYKRPWEMSGIKGIGRVFLPNAILLVLIGKENLSTAIVIAVIVYGMCFIGAFSLLL